MRQHCAYALGNLAADNSEIVSMLVKEGAVQAVAALLQDKSTADAAKEQAARALMLMSLAGDASVQGRICCATAVSAITACMHAEGSTATCRTYCAQAMHALAAHASSLPVLVAAEAPMHLEQTLATAVEASEVHSAAVSALGMLTRHAIEGGDAAAMAAVLEHNTPAGKREVLKALRRIAEGGERAAELVAAGVVRLLVEVVRTTDGQWEVGGSEDDAMCTLAKLAAVEACAAELIEVDVLKLLMQVLWNEKAPVSSKEFLLAILVAICITPGARLAVMKQNGLYPICDSLRDGTERMKEGATALIYGLSQDRDHRAPILRSGAVPALVTMVRCCALRLRAGARRVDTIEHAGEGVVNWVHPQFNSSAGMPRRRESGKCTIHHRERGGTARTGDPPERMLRPLRACVADD